MPRLTTLHYNNENLSFKYDVSIDQLGNFTTMMPEDVVKKLESIGVKLNTGSGRRRHKKGFFSATSLQELEKKVKETADKYSRKKLVSEKIIIRYAVDTRCSYCRSANGNIYPNGGLEQDAEGYDKGYHWINGTKDTHGFNTGPYSIEIAFEIKKVRTWEFPSGEQTKEYDRLEESEAKKDDALFWLHSLCGLTLSSDNTAKEIEYTKDIGFLFKNMVLFIFNINERIRSIFGEEFDLTKIEPLRLTDGNPLLMKDEKIKNFARKKQ